MNIGVIFAGGIGSRMNSNGVPKQFLKLHGKEIIIYTIEKFEKNDQIDGIVISCLEEKIDFLKELIDKYKIEKVKKIVPGGKTGQESIYNCLKVVEKEFSKDSIVLIHDGVRPLINDRVIDDNISSVKEKGSSITVAPAIETIIHLEEEGRKIKEVIKRDHCYMARAPQSFYLKDILGCHNKAKKEAKEDFIDSASMMKYYGFDLNIVEGPMENIKITTASDFYIFKAVKDLEESRQILGF